MNEPQVHDNNVKQNLTVARKEITTPGGTPLVGRDKRTGAEVRRTLDETGHPAKARLERPCGPFSRGRHILERANDGTRPIFHHANAGAGTGAATQ